MPVLQSLATLGRLIRRTPPPPVEHLEAYAHQVIPVADRAEWLYQYWLEQTSLFSDSEKLGNVAAIHRWETATMGRSLESVTPPAVLAQAHAGVVEALEMASRAAQLLSSGSRFHNAGAVCEGHAMLGASRDRRLAALKAMRRYLAPVVVAAAAQEEAAQAATLSEAAAVASAQGTQPTATASGSEPLGMFADAAAPPAETAGAPALFANPATVADDADPANVADDATDPDDAGDLDHADAHEADEGLPSFLAAAQDAAQDTSQDAEDRVARDRASAAVDGPTVALLSQDTHGSTAPAPSLAPAAPSPPASAQPAPTPSQPPAPNEPASTEPGAPDRPGWGALFDDARRAPPPG